VNVDWFFLSHRLQIALTAQSNEFDVTIVAKDTGNKKIILNHGLRFIDLPINRSKLNILKDINTIQFLINLYRMEKPDFVHHITIKPVLFGSLAARLTKVKYVVNAISGLGHIFIGNNFLDIVLRKFIKMFYKISFFKINKKVIFQNKHDQALFIKSKIVRNYQTEIIRGSGVNLKEYKYISEGRSQIVILFASRLLWTKGIGVFIEAAKIILKEKINAKFIVVGRLDYDNPARVFEKEMINWQNDDLIEWGGHVTNVMDILAKSNIVCLPTFYGEGIPKILIEAASCGRAIIATDVPGCNDIVTHYHNGLLIPPHNVDALVESLKILINDDHLRMTMGKRSRELAENYFSIDLIVKQHMDIYRSFLNIN